MAVSISTVCYAFLNSYAYGPPEYKEGFLLGTDADAKNRAAILAPVPFPLRSSKNFNHLPSQNIVGVFRCVPERASLDFSTNDLLSIPEYCKYFCLVQYRDSRVSIRLLRVNTDRESLALNPVEYNLFPDIPTKGEVDSHLEKHLLDPSISDRLETINKIMAVSISTVCYAFLNSYAYGPPEYKEGFLLGTDADAKNRAAILAPVPFPLRSSKNFNHLPSQNIVGVFRCVPERASLDFSTNDLLSIPEYCKYFCLVQYRDSRVSIRLLRVNTDRESLALNPVEYNLFPDIPTKGEVDSHLEKHLLDPSISDRLETINKIMAVSISTVCYAFLNSYAYGPPEYKEGFLLGTDADAKNRAAILAPVPFPLRSSKNFNHLPSQNIVGVFRCVPERASLDFSTNDLLSIPEYCKYFCLVQYRDSRVSIRLLRVNTDRESLALNPVEYNLFPDIPTKGEVDSHLEKHLLDPSISDRLETINKIMAVSISTVCYAFLNSYAYGPPEYKEGFLLGTDADAKNRAAILAPVPFPLRSSKNFNHLPSQNIVGVFRCVPERASLDFSTNDLLSIPEYCKYFCLVQYRDSRVSIRLLRVNTDRESLALNPVEYNLFPDIPTKGEVDSHLEKHLLDPSISDRLETINNLNSQLRRAMANLFDEFPVPQ
ncbi:hypothetical protein Aperf_G00000125731 [Anoplocephala perfoliata]